MKTVLGASGSCKKERNFEARVMEVAKQISQQAIGGRGLLVTGGR